MRDLWHVKRQHGNQFHWLQWTMSRVARREHLAPRWSGQIEPIHRSRITRATKMARAETLRRLRGSREAGAIRDKLTADISDTPPRPTRLYNTNTEEKE